ncbi:uncharacterized protein LOC115465546 isoform X1 [Microcaecilia unicolor]|uniref:Uncharacterized protein LOC115465546 isoform X1 n=1 Tax=Microcaecilia unicolor TaxID=1415580 RepID=A0A6P7XFH6_9AMPH|nr:uncharacterized protein LOC115465546 isoform X1 [Microcaecilia unicolor]
MKLSLLLSVVAFFVLMVAVVATAFPSSRDPREASAGKQPTQDKPTLRRRDPKRKGKLSQSSRHGKNYFGQRYSLGHGGVAFLTKGEIEVMRPSEADLSPTAPTDERDRCLGCCDVNATDFSELQGTERGDGNWIITQTNKNATFMTGVNVPELVGEEPFYTDDHCLDCCVVVTVAPGPEPEKDGGTPGPSAVNAQLPSETKEGTINQPRQKPSHFHLDYEYVWGTSSESSSEEVRASARNRARDTAVDGTPIQKVTKKQPSQAGGMRAHPSSSVSSSSEEILAALLFGKRDKLSRRE